MSDHLDQSLAKFRAAIAAMSAAMAAAERAAEELRGKLEAEAGSVPAPERIWCIQEIVATHFGYTRDRMLKRDRTAEVTRARMTSMALCRELTRFSLVSIGMAHGGLDHTSVIHAAKTIASDSATEPTFAAEVEKIRAKVANGLVTLASADPSPRRPEAAAPSVA